MAEIMNGTIKIEDKASPALTALENALVKLVEENKKLSDVLKTNDDLLKKLAATSRSASKNLSVLGSGSPTLMGSISGTSGKVPLTKAKAAAAKQFVELEKRNNLIAMDRMAANVEYMSQMAGMDGRKFAASSKKLHDDYALSTEQQHQRELVMRKDAAAKAKAREGRRLEAVANDVEIARKKNQMKIMEANAASSASKIRDAANVLAAQKRVEVAQQKDISIVNRAFAKKKAVSIQMESDELKRQNDRANELERNRKLITEGEFKRDLMMKKHMEVERHAGVMTAERVNRERKMQVVRTTAEQRRLAERERSTARMKANVVATEQQKSNIRIAEYQAKIDANNAAKMQAQQQKINAQKEMLRIREEAKTQARQERQNDPYRYGRHRGLSQFFPKGDGMVSRGIGWAIGKLPAFHALGMVADVIMGIAQTVGQILKVISNSGDKERRLQQKMILSPEMFGIAKEDDKGRQKFTRELYEQAKVDSMNGLNGMEILESGVHWAHLLGASEKDPNAKFKSFDEAKKFAKSLNAISLMNGVDKQQMEVFRYQMTQVAAKGYAGRLDIRPMQESSPGMLREIVKVLHLTQEDLQNAGMTKSITWEDMKWAILQLEDKYSKLAKQERMQTIEGQKELGRNYQEASMSDFNAATGEVINTEGTFVMYKMFGDIIADIGKSMFGTTEKLDMFSEAMENVFIWIDIFVRSLYILGKVFVDSIQVLWNIAWIIIDIVLLLGVLVVGGVASGFTKILDLVAHGWELLGRAVLWGFSALMGYIMDWMYEETGWKIFKTTWSKDAAEAKKEFMTSAFGSEEDRVSGRIAKGTRELTKTGLEGINGWIEEDKGDMSRASLDAGRTIKTQFDQTVEDIKKITERENEFGKDPEAKIKEDLQKIEKNTGRSARASEKTNENIEILREIAGYQVINRVTRVQPNHYYNFGDIRSEEISTDQIVPSIANALKRGEPIFNNLGPSQVDTISAPMGMLAG